MPLVVKNRGERKLCSCFSFLMSRSTQTIEAWEFFERPSDYTAQPLFNTLNWLVLCAIVEHNPLLVN